jgi:general secretion pathway protein G
MTRGLRAALLVALAVLLACRPAPDRARELRASLSQLRSGLKLYRDRFGHGPESLRELVSTRMLREIPLDPLTHSRNTWRIVAEESVVVSEDFKRDVPVKTAPRAYIIEVHSGAPGTDPDGRQWSEY